MPTADDLERIAAVEHDQPHHVLGPHLGDGELVIRAYRPDALEVTILPDVADRPPAPMRPIHEGGIHEARFPAVDAPFPYHLGVRTRGGELRLRDPYAFPPALGELDIHLAAEGTHEELYRRLGAHVVELGGVSGVAFAVWAPGARRVSVVGTFNRWDGRLHAMRRLGGGIWEIFLPDLGDGELYKYELKAHDGTVLLKADPVGRAMELPPRSASRVAVRRHEFQDDRWSERRAASRPHREPVSIYEVHLGSWHQIPTDEPDAPREPGSAGRWLRYDELSERLVDYVTRLGFTHVELLPVMEHPYGPSWGYQVTGYFAPTSRFGAPDGLRRLVDRCHARGLGVLLDWPPAHFPKDAYALGRFDGTALYEHLDPRRGEHRHWDTYIFNYGRREVQNFLLAAALYWMDEFHADGLRVDAVASMLYLDYSARGPGDWVPNVHGGRENLEAVDFLRRLNEVLHRRFPGAVVAAEESTTWPGVTRPTYVGGLGFDFKWNMGWMHDTLDYFSLDPIHRAFHHQKLTFGLTYAFNESFVLPLSHDEVVHLKRSLLSKMPGDRWQKFANLRALYGYMWSHPGKKLLFMGGELGQWREWDYASSLDWHLLESPEHRGLQLLIGDLNRLYRSLSAMHEQDHLAGGFAWIDANDAQQSVVSYLRYPEDRGRYVVCVGNFTPVVRHGYRVGVPRGGRHTEVLNTDATAYGGSGVGNLGGVVAEPVPSHGHPFSLLLTLPPLAMVWLVPEIARAPDVDVSGETAQPPDVGAVDDDAASRVAAEEGGDTRAPPGSAPSASGEP